MLAMISAAETTGRTRRPLSATVAKRGLLPRPIVTSAWECSAEMRGPISEKLRMFSSSLTRKLSWDRPNGPCPVAARTERSYGTITAAARIKNNTG